MARFLQGNLTFLNRCSSCFVISLLEHQGFHPNNIRILTDDQRRNLPTKANIVINTHLLSHPSPDLVKLAAMRWLVDSAQPSDSQFFYCKFYTGPFVDCPQR